jgi:heme/copper-type cytochrome/quinol oxidase subunit 2
MIASWRRALAWFAPLLVVGAAILFAPVPMPAPQERDITIDASQFQFTPGRVEVNYGDHVHLTLTASDVTHGFYLDGYGIQQRLTPGVSQQVDFVASQDGTFRFRCAVSCGPLHPFMIGELVVGPNLPFWRALALTLAALTAMLLYLWTKKGTSHVSSTQSPA